MPMNMNIDLNKIKMHFAEKGGKAAFDIVAVLLVPLLLAGGYYFWSGDEDSALLSLVVTKQDGQEFGAKAKAALEKLRSIKMDGSLFEDPAYLSLKEFHVDIDMVIPLGRPYPFTPPDVLRNRVKPTQVVPTNP